MDPWIEKLKTSFIRERSLQAEFLTYLAEVEARGLYQPAGFSSIFSFLTKELRLSESSAMKRIQASRCAVRFPKVLELLRRNEISLSTICLLAPHLKTEDAEELLEKAKGLSRVEVERLLVKDNPKPEPKESIRHFETANDGSSAAAPPPQDGQVPLSESRTFYRFCGGREFDALFEEARALMSHQFPQGQMEEIFGAALKALLAAKRPKAVRPNRSSMSVSRYIPRGIRAHVWKRDHGRCQFISKDGRRCGERRFLHFDHVKPWAKGGVSTDPANIRLLCSAHNLWRARQEMPHFARSASKRSLGAR